MRVSIGAVYVSTAETGTARIAAEAVAAARDQFDQAVVPFVQPDMFNPLSADDLLEARIDLGKDADNVHVLAHARAKKAGRKPGSLNRRSDDFSRYLMQFGGDPAVGMMVLANTDPHALIEASRRTVQRMNKNGNLVSYEESMSYSEALSHIAHAQDGLMPYMHSKKPVAVDLRVAVDGALSIPGVTDEHVLASNVIEGDFVEIDPDFDDADVDDGRAA